MKRLIGFLLSAVCLTTACMTGTDAFVRIEEGHFVRHGEPFYFIGTNLWYGPILASQGEGGDRERLCRELDALCACGMTNLRVLVGADGPEGVVSKVSPTLQPAPGTYNNELLDGLDWFMQQLGERDMTAVLYLNNAWEWSGGYSQYLEWTGAGRAPIPAVDGWGPYMRYVEQFIPSQEARALFADHVRFIVGRTNRYTGRKYSEDPAIFAWQIANEPHAFGEKNKEDFAEWIGETARLIRSLDPNHLISTGSEGIRGCENNVELTERIHAFREIDYINLHIWPYNWHWVAADRMADDLPQAIDETDHYIDRHIAMAARLGKPVVIEEFGFPRDGFRFDPASATALRDRYYRTVFDRVIASKEVGGLLAGCNFWGWGGEARPKRLYWQTGEPYCGDPAQEQQGLNSVFDCDSSTMALIRRSTARLNAPAPEPETPVAVLKHRLQRCVESGMVLFGHQDDLFYGTAWKGWEAPEQSDVRAVAGDYPAVLGVEIGGIENGDSLSLDGVPFRLIREGIRSHHRRGGIVTVSWHADNPVTGGDSWDVAQAAGTVASVLPGGPQETRFRTWIGRVAGFLSSLRDDDGRPIPIIWRPWHENAGGWFWWGAPHCSSEAYRALWQRTRILLEEEYGLTDLLWAYSPGFTAECTNGYTDYYPGDGWVDIIGIDSYQYGQADFAASLNRKLTDLAAFARRHGKILALTETGCEGLPDPTWWTQTLEPALQGLPIAYVLTWRNAWDRPGHYYATWRGEASSEDFCRFVVDGRIALLGKWNRLNDNTHNR